MGECPHCGSEVELGFVAVSLDGSATPLFWVQGPATQERITRAADVRGRKRMPITGARCPRCGIVLLTADDGEAQT